MFTVIQIHLPSFFFKHNVQYAYYYMLIAYWCQSINVNISVIILPLWKENQNSLEVKRIKIAVNDSRDLKLHLNPQFTIVQDYN